MFKSLDEAYEALTPKFWRDVIRGEKVALKKENNPDNKDITTNIMSFSEIYSPLETSSTHKENVQKLMRFNKNQVSPYIKANFTDSLEYLVHKKIIFRVHNWRCKYCGRVNAVSIDNLKNKNNCEICDTHYELPINFECTYKLNDFVVNSLSKNNGLTILWTLGFLHDREYRDDFIYIPEIRLFDKHDDKQWAAEIDIVCILGGKLYIGEVKRSVAAFVNKDNDVNKFIEVIKRIKPDVALLSFEQYGNNPEEDGQMKIKLQEVVSKIKSCCLMLEVKTLIANENDSDFNRYPVSLYPAIGERSRDFWK